MVLLTELSLLSYTNIKTITMMLITFYIINLININALVQ